MYLALNLNSHLTFCTRLVYFHLTTIAALYNPINSRVTVIISSQFFSQSQAFRSNCKTVSKRHLIYRNVGSVGPVSGNLVASRKAPGGFKYNPARPFRRIKKNKNDKDCQYTSTVFDVHKIKYDRRRAQEEDTCKRKRRVVPTTEIE